MKQQRDRWTASTWPALLLIVVGAIFSWLPGSAERFEPASHRAEIAQPEGPFHAGPVRVAPEQAPDQDELETLSEEAEDPLVALGQPEPGFESSTDGATGEHGAVVGWTVRSPTFPSSTARGPPQL